MMDKRTSDALEQSIAHWGDNIAAEKLDDVSLDGKDCALCQMFFDGDNCSGCPVKKRSGRPYCKGTPYVSAADAFDEWEESIDRNRDLDGNVTSTKEIDDAREAWRTAARAEHEFLISLREPTAVTP